VLAGGAGLRIGWALIAPGRLSRRRALVEAGTEGAQLVFGVLVLLVIAAFVEAFWSSIGWIAQRGEVRRRRPGLGGGVVLDLARGSRCALST
jgi:uncharacterized membrane protein SpoIIM required for sporulation